MTTLMRARVTERFVIGEEERMEKTNKSLGTEIYVNNVTIYVYKRKSQKCVLHHL